ncbi:MAG: GFA family protein [Gammaproteobacteria bacterium]
MLLSEYNRGSTPVIATSLMPDAGRHLIRESDLIAGECFCGTVQYQIDGELTFARCCHCSRCRKAFSGASSAYAELADPESFSWVSGADNLQEYSAQADWGLTFCKTCGTTLCGIYQGRVHGVALGTVIGDPGVEIEAHYFVGSKAPWDHIGGSAPQFDTREK